jgi:NitT/TauT family transport system permease protein
VSKKPISKAIATPFREIPRGLTIGLPIVIWIAVIAVWFLVTYSGWIPSIFLPRPDTVVERTFAMAADGSLWEHVSASIEVVMIGFVISSIIAVPLGLFMGTYRVVQATLDPLVNFIRYLPVTSLIPLFILWIGIDIRERIAVIFFGTFFQQVVMFADAGRSVPRDLVNAAYTLGTRRKDTVFHIVLPATLPNILDILRVTMGWAWTYVVAAELVAASAGLGYISMKALRGFQVDVIFMAVALIGILGVATDQIFRLIRRLAAPWAN